MAGPAGWLAADACSNSPSLFCFPLLLPLFFQQSLPLSLPSFPPSPPSLPPFLVTERTVIDDRHSRRNNHNSTAAGSMAGLAGWLAAVQTEGYTGVYEPPLPSKRRLPSPAAVHAEGYAGASLRCRVWTAPMRMRGVQVHAWRASACVTWRVCVCVWIAPMCMDRRSMNPLRPFSDDYTAVEAGS
jgi:hypothetical protein